MNEADPLALLHLGGGKELVAAGDALEAPVVKPHHRMPQRACGVYDAAIEHLGPCGLERRQRKAALDAHASRARAPQADEVRGRPQTAAEVARDAAHIGALRDDEAAAPHELVGLLDADELGLVYANAARLENHLLARAGEEVVLEPRRIRIDKAQLVGIEEADELVWRCRFVVSKGTYVRSIARDLGRSLGTAAHLVGLRRTGAGSVRIEGCLPLAALEAAGTQMLDRCIIDPTSALGHAVMRLDDRGFERVSCGHQLFAPSEVEEGERVSLVHDGRLVGVWCRRGSRLVCVANFPQGISGVLS